jgi:ammonia channel protein AmtB
MDTKLKRDFWRGIGFFALLWVGYSMFNPGSNTTTTTPVVAKETNYTIALAGSVQILSHI